VLDLFILAPLACLILINLPPVGSRRLALPLAMVLAGVQAIAVLCLPYMPRLDGPLTSFFNFGLQITPLGRMLLLAVGLVAFVSLLVGQASLGQDRRLWQFASMMLLAITGMNGAVLVSDLFSLYVFMEVLAVCSFILIAFNRDPLALEGAFKYVILSAVASVLMLGSLSLMLLVAGSTGFAALKAALAAGSASPLLKLAMAGFVCGLFIKGGLAPFHAWLPGAYSSAPAAVSVLLAGVGTKVSGLYALLRLAMDVLPPSAALGQAVMVVGAFSMVVGAVAALVQKDIKRLLAYSSISQMGYVVLAAGCFLADAGSADWRLVAAGELAMAGAIFHLFNHSVFKSLLFVNSAAVERQAGTTDMQLLGGLGSRMPVTGATSVIAALSTAGVPPLAGFWSKLVIILALWQSGMQAYALLAVAVSVATLGYLLLMQRRVFFGRTAPNLQGVREGSEGYVVAELILATVTVLVGLAFPLLMHLGSFLLPANLNL
jgi:multicomponent Na+:H+ antiporter subunit D